EQILFEFQDNISGLKKIAEQIKKTTYDSDLVKSLYRIGNDEEDENLQVKEGKVIYKLHRHIERNGKINKRKKNNHLKKHGKLECEVCGFDFHKKYGEIGKGFIECHHRKPLHEINGETETSLNDLALVCANCHRMLHRQLDALSIEELKTKIIWNSCQPLPPQNPNNPF
ncbi:MAG: HNH endonuclease, partial [Allomuricauda sp.]